MNALDELLTTTGWVQGPAPETLGHGRDELDAALLELSLDSPAVHRGRSLRRTLTLTGLAAAGVAALLTVPVLSVGGGGGGGHHDPASTASAETVLREAGQSAGAQPGGWPNAGYWHVTSTYVDPGLGSHKAYSREIWVAHHGQSVLHDAGITRGGDPAYISTDGGFTAGSTALTWDQLYALPTQPAALKSALLADIRGAGTDDNAELFEMVGDLLRESPASPALREALYDIAAGIPGVRSTGWVIDARGRAGVAVERGAQTYVIAPGNGQLLAESDVHATENDPSSTITYSTTYISQGPSNSAPVVTGN